MPSDNHRSVSSESYTRDYYESHCHGYAEFRESRGEIISDRLKIPLELAELSAGMSVLDVGCGRGEVLLQIAQYGARGFGFDYAVSAIEIASEVVANQLGAGKVLIHQGNAQYLPYPDNCFDRVFMLDVVEHMYPDELQQALTEIRRVLRPDGWLVIHTMPNTWYYRVGYPLYRLVQRVRGKRLPADPRERWGYKEVHVNEQNLLLLNHELRTAGFRSKVWLYSIHTYHEEPNRFVRLVMRALVTLYPFRLIFCDDLFALAVKRTLL